MAVINGLAGGKGIYITHYTEKTVKTDKAIARELFNACVCVLALCYFVLFSHTL